MSATNRGSIRNESDYYKTPEWCIDLFLKEFGEPIGSEIFEPCAGDGAIIKSLHKNYQGLTIRANEIRKEEKDNLYNAGAWDVTIADFLEYNNSNSYVDLVITNPPYSIAQEIIEHCFEYAPKAEIVMLLRLAFLESKKRRKFWKKHPLTQLYILSERPSFTGHGTDATAYAWFVWSQYRQPLIKPI
jgi:hypothetical protein